MVERRRWFIYTYILDPEEADEDVVVDYNGAGLGEDYESGLGESGVSTDMAEWKTDEVEEAQQAVKYTSLF